LVYHGVSLLFGETDDRPPDSQAEDLSARWRYTTRVIGTPTQNGFVGVELSLVRTNPP